jgi:hypothetical protein
MYKKFRLTDDERKEIMEAHKSHGYKKPINELGDKEIGLVRGNPDFKLKVGKPTGNYPNERDAARQFQQDFKKDYPDPGIEDVPFWEKDQARPSGDSLDDREPRKLSDETIQKRNEKLKEKQEKEKEEKIVGLKWELQFNAHRIDTIQKNIEYIVNRVSQKNSDMFEKIAEIMTSDIANDLDTYGIYYTEYIRYKNEYIDLTGDEVEKIQSPKGFINDLLRSNLK